MQKHKVFISFYYEDDVKYKDSLVNTCSPDYFIDWSVDTGDIKENLDDQEIRQIIRDDYLRDSTVTIVLLGENNWKRKHIDWEISSSLRDGKINKRSGLLGILLPSHPAYSGQEKITKCNTNKRFVDNLKNGYAPLIKWGFFNCNDLNTSIHDAFLKKDSLIPDNSELIRRKNNNS